MAVMETDEAVKNLAKIVLESTSAPKHEGATVYGTVVTVGDNLFVKLDGSDQLTPIDIMTDVVDGERVSVYIKNHQATVTGNFSSPSARSATVKEIDGKIAQIETDNILVNDTLEAHTAEIEELVSENASITGRLDANEASIDKLETEKLDASVANIQFATIEDLEVATADIRDLETDFATVNGTLTAHEALIDSLEADKLDAEDANLWFATIDFANITQAAIQHLFTESGIIKDLAVESGHITGELVGVTIKGDLIEGGTVVADKLVVKGEDGLYYKLNTDGVTTEAEQTDYNSLNGSVITAKSITATKINVSDLVAFGATIGGFKIGQHSLYSGVKESVANTTPGVFMGDDGQIAVGNSDSYLKFYKDANGVFRLAIKADSMSFKSGVTVGSRNLLLNSDFSSEFAQLVSSKNAYGLYSRGGVYTVTRDETTKREGKPSLKIAASTAGNASGKDICWAFVPIEDSLQTGTLTGRAVTFSFWAKAQEGSPKLNARLGYESYDADKAVTLSTSWQRYVIQITESATAKADREIIFYLDSSCVVWLSECKAELGSIVTDWTPAPEDSNDIFATKASLDVAADAIRAEVSETYSTKEESAQMAQPNLRPMFSATPISQTDNNDWWDNVNHPEALTPMSDGWCHVEYTNSTTSVVFVNYFDTLCDSIKPGCVYTLLIEIRNDVGESDASVNYGGDFVNSSFITSSSRIGEGTHYAEITSKDDLSGTTGCLRCYTGFGAGSSKSFDVRISLYEGEYSGPYKPYIFSSDDFSLTYAKKSELEITADEIRAEVSAEYQVKGDYATSADLDDISVGGRNLARKTSGEWSEWWSPNYGVNNSTTYQASAMFPDTTQAGDDVTCQVEMEFDGIEADEAGGFTIYTQGPVDGAWDVTNVWTRLFDLKEPPADGVYKYVKTLPYPASSVGRLNHSLGIRCNYVSAGRMRWRCIKVELGNKPTDWSPAPEDMLTNADAEATYASKTLVTQTAEEIKSEAQSTYQVKGDYPTTTQMNSAITQSANQIKSEVSQTYQVKGDYPTTTQMNSAITQKANEINQTVSAVKNTAESALSRVTLKDTRNDNQPPIWYFTNYPRQEVHEFKTCSAIGLPGSNGTYCYLTTQVPWSGSSGGYPKQVAMANQSGKQFWRVGTADSTWSSWVDAYGTATNAQNDLNAFKNTVASTYATKTSLTSTAESIKAEAEKTYATFEDLNSINVGGRNLIRGSANGTLDYTTGNGTLQDGGVFGCKAVRTTNAWNGYQIHMLDIANRVGLADGDEVTLSIYVSTDSDVEVSPTISLYRHNGAGTSQGFGTVPLAPGVWTRLSVNFKITDASALVNTARFESHAATSYGILWSAPKLERGNKVTDWTPAPEDADLTYATKSELEVKAESITSTVNSVKTTAESAQATATQAKQTADSFEARVTTAQTTATNAQNAVDGLEFGGRNLLYGTAYPVLGSGLPYWTKSAGSGTMAVGSTSGVPDVGDAQVFSYTNSTAATAAYMATVTQAGIAVEFGATYTMSMWVYINQASSSPMQFTMRCFNGSNQTFKNISVSTKSKWQRIEWTFEMPSNVVASGATTVRFGCVPGTGQVASVAFGLMKMERGNKASAWCPEPAIDTIARLAADGLTIGDMSKGTLARNILITAASIILRNGSTTLASFDDEGLKFPGTAVMKKSNTSSSKSLDIINGNGPTSISAYNSADYMANTSLINLNGDIYMKNGTGSGRYFYGNLSDIVTARGTNSDGEWRKFASGSWEYWLNYKNLSCKPNGTTNLTIPIPSAIGNKNANYVVLANFTMMSGSALPDGWSKMAIGVVSQTTSQFTLRIWGDNTFASPYLVMSLNIHILGRS